MALAIVLGLAVGYIYQQQANSKQAAAQNAEMSATMGQMQEQIAVMTSKLNQAPAEPTPSAANTAKGLRDCGNRKTPDGGRKQAPEGNAGEIGLISNSS